MNFKFSDATKHLEALTESGEAFVPKISDDNLMYSVEPTQMAT